MTGKVLAELTAYKVRPWVAKFSPDANRLVTVSQDGTRKVSITRLWDANTGKELGVLGTGRTTSAGIRRGGRDLWRVELGGGGQI